MTDYIGLFIVGGITAYGLWESYEIARISKLIKKCVDENGNPDYKKITKELENYNKRRFRLPLSSMIAIDLEQYYNEVSKIF
ncbi:MAG: hypothetical protein KQA40_00930 [Candidatus Aenigmarchaeota archaeon]|nr:hypothetical protein [Candidatus Aenigmarchaeota archaeon]